MCSNRFWHLLHGGVGGGSAEPRERTAGEIKRCNDTKGGGRSRLLEAKLVMDFKTYFAVEAAIKAPFSGLRDEGPPSSHSDSTFK